MKRQIDKLMRLIANHFVFDEQTYPELKGATKSQRLVFALRHLGLHFSKTAGKINAVSEAVDHGKEIDIADIKTNIPKSLINTLRLAELVGMSEAEIIQAIEEKYGERIHPISNSRE